jgi:hypothetical protein
MGIISASRLRASSDLIYYIDATKQESYSGTGTVINDLSNSNITTRFSGGSYDNSGFFKFENLREFLNLDSNLNISSGGYTFETYFRLDSLNTNRNHGFFRSDRNFLALRGSTNILWLGIRTPNGDYSGYLSNSNGLRLPVGELIHFVSVIGVNSFKFFIDGDLVLEESNLDNFVSSLSIRGLNYQLTTDQNIFASYKNILFYDRVLTNSEVNTTYNYFKNLYNL